MKTRKKFYEKTPDHLKHSTDAQLVAYQYPEQGWWPIYTGLDPSELNHPDATPEIIESASIGSMFGFDVPGAKLASDFATKVEEQNV